MGYLFFILAVVFAFLASLFFAILLTKKKERLKLEYALAEALDEIEDLKNVNLELKSIASESISKFEKNVQHTKAKIIALEEENEELKKEIYDLKEARNETIE